MKIFMTVICGIFSSCLAFTAYTEELAPMKVEGKNLTVNGKEIRLRGINWGWWNFEGTRYTENDMQRQSEWGANCLRFPFCHTDITDADGKIVPEKIATIDEVIGWAKKYKQYVILDMHRYPGKKNHQQQQIWTNPEAQKRYIDLWKALAARYRHNTTVAAYELMNEPQVTPINPQLVAALNQQTVKAIREIDQNKILVVSGDDDSQCPFLTDIVKIDDSQILYTAHFYDGAMGAGWLKNFGEGKQYGTNGTHDWTKFEITFTTMESIEKFCFLLRSTDNCGEAWFDDIAIYDVNGNVLRSFSFDRNAEGFAPERGTNIGELAYDPVEGHNGAGSLRIGKTFTFQGWASPQWEIKSRCTYTISGWIKLKNGTGSTYIAAAIFGTRLPDEAAMRKTLSIPAAFSSKYNVPVLIGEFSMVASVGPQLQTSEIDKRIKLFEEFGFNWTYWNYRETTSPDTMALHAINRRTGKDYPLNTSLLDCLKKWWCLNNKKSNSEKE